MCQKSRHLWFAHLGGISHLVETDETRNPVAVGLFGSQTKMLQSHYIPHLIESFLLGLLAVASLGRTSSMIPFLSDCPQVSKRIRRNNSVKYYGKIPSIPR
jgi:hypothetical protein